MSTLGMTPNKEPLNSANFALCICGANCVCSRAASFVRLAS